MTKGERGLPDDCHFDEEGDISCHIDGEEIDMDSCYYKLGVNSYCTDEQGDRHYFSEKIFDPNTNEDRKVESKGQMVARMPEVVREGKSLKDVFKGEKKTMILEKDLYWAGRLSELGEGGEHYQIENREGQLVRDIEVTEDSIIIDAFPETEEEPPIELPKEMDVLYEPWIMDRGSFMFVNPPGNFKGEGQLLKLATEGDSMEVIY